MTKIQKIRIVSVVFLGLFQAGVVCAETNLDNVKNTPLKDALSAGPSASPQPLRLAQMPTLLGKGGDSLTLSDSDVARTKRFGLNLRRYVALGTKSKGLVFDDKREEIIRSLRACAQEKLDRGQPLACAWGNNAGASGEGSIAVGDNSRASHGELVVDGRVVAYVKGRRPSSAKIVLASGEKRRRGKK